MLSEADFSKPIKVDAKSQFVDGKNKTSLFKDDVLITQGSLIINADEVEVIASEGEGKEVFVARGNPASYSQQLEDGTPVSAKANEIRYEVVNRTISLNGKAELKQDTSMVQGDSITFDMITEQLLAIGGDDDNGEGRVTTVFTPETIRKSTSKDDDDDNEGNQ
ncbi:lipopolysaccharide transport periplasmic protein LptA [Alteromonas gracilis]|uniref:lipopolysaccharide transport periplasmic protein LptA n=1 Tax=Alteromonas gracilis TaxID=1479524 RepID=UPI00321B426F